MSYSTLKNLEEIRNKKVLFYDLETTGLVKTLTKLKSEEKFPDYKELNEYDNARIVSIGWIYSKKFCYEHYNENEISIKDINECIIKPKNFIIPDNAIKIHGITNEEANKKGKKIKKYLKKIGRIIKKCDYIVGYNIYYDINVLLSELYRKKRNKTINKILQMKEDKKIICLGEISKKYCGKKYMPKQIDIYKKLFEKDMELAHNAKHDVLGMIEIMIQIYKNSNSIGYNKN